ncbi:MAG: hypothetical protein U0414_18820 [Polyangiaceae bacterium]
MWGDRVRATGVLGCVAGLASASCAATPPPAPPAVGAALPRPGAPWPSATPTCVLTSEAGDSCAPGFDVRGGPAGHAIARVERRDLADVEWLELPVLGAPPIARVRVTADGAVIEGFASIEDERFELRSILPVVRGHVWVPTGAKVELLGTTGGALAVRVPTPFEAPKSLELTAECDAFGSPRAVTRVPTGPPFARSLVRSLDLRSAPDGPVVFSFVPRADAAFVLFERRGSAAHIAGGVPPWVADLGDETLLFDGWVDGAQIHATDTHAEGPDTDDACSVLDVADVCGGHRVSMPSTLYVGMAPDLEVAGEIDGSVLMDERVGDFVSVSTPNRAIQPPKGARFWVRAVAVDDPCIDGSDEAGCPCE